MCGISGFIDFTKKTDVNNLKDMTRQLIHRGPDGEGYAIFDSQFATIGFGHRRLSIIDLSTAGSQPMHFENLHIVFNGEIYNYVEVKKELTALGHSFVSSSDTEVILHAYKEWGDSCINKFIGMFTIVIFDDINNSVFICRDRAGVKPFFYYWHNDLFLFASELKAFVKHPFFKKELNIDSLSAYMQYGYVPTPHCIYNYCKKLEPGHYANFNLENKAITLKKYWSVYDAYNKPKISIDFEEAKLETDKLLTSAFNYRMVSDVPVGVFLSGGIDSSCVAAILQKSNIEKINTYTIGFEDEVMNEAPQAKAIAKHLNTAHHEFYCTTKEATDLINDLPFFYDEPFADSSAIPTMLVSKIARQHVTVALSADAGDEIFAGYNRYDYILKYSKLIANTPKFLRKGIEAFMSNIPANKIPVLNKKYLFSSRYNKVKNVIKSENAKDILHNLSKGFSDNEVALLFKQPINTLTTNFQSNKLSSSNYSILSDLMATDYETYMLDDILQKVDRATMSVGLEGREPFLDQRIIEWAAVLPDHFKYNNGEKKYILKEVLYKYVPKALLDKPKMGFAIPLTSLLLSEYKSYVEHYLSSDFIKKQSIFNEVVVENIKTSFYNGRTELTEKLWTLLMFQMWYDNWMK